MCKYLATARKVRIFRYKLKNKGYGHSRKYKSNM